LGSKCPEFGHTALELDTNQSNRNTRNRILNQYFRRTQRWLWVGLILTLGMLCLALLLANLRMRTIKPLPVLGTVSEFRLTNQLSQPISLNDLRGHVWVADIIFTRCAGPCLTMSRHMKELQGALPPSSNTRLISLTTDPRFDVPPVLEQYAQRFKADPKRWMFLTGTQQEIANVASNSLRLAAVEKLPEERESAVDLFIHSTIFVVVDKKGQLRGIFETTGEGISAGQVKAEILSAVHQLERER
jgi:protein SCO1/2